GARQVGAFGAQIAQRHARRRADMVDTGCAARAPRRLEAHTVGLRQRMDGDLVVNGDRRAAGTIMAGAAIIGAQRADAGLVIIPQIGAGGGMAPGPVPERDAARLDRAGAGDRDLASRPQMCAGFRPASRDRKAPAIAGTITAAVGPREAIEHDLAGRIIRIRPGRRDAQPDPAGLERLADDLLRSKTETADLEMARHDGEGVVAGDRSR